MAVKTKGKELEWYLEQSPRFAEAVREGRYMGVLIVQDPAAWTRLGPTWWHPQIGWLVVGPGVSNWGTKQGLAELAVSSEPTPSWHATAGSISPKPNILFVVGGDIIEHLEPVKDLAKDAEKLEEDKNE